jgi:hypothetical protein
LDKNSIADETEGWIKADAIKELRSTPIAIGDQRAIPSKRNYVFS